MIRPAIKGERPPTEAALLPQAVTVPCVLNLEDDNRHDGRHHDRSGQYRHQRKHFLAGRLEAGRGKPFLHMRSCLRLPGLASELVAHSPRLCALGLLAQAFCLLRQTLMEWGVLFEPASLHGAAPSLEEAGAQTGVLITDRSH
jgi:hypothetical protein